MTRAQPRSAFAGVAGGLLATAAMATSHLLWTRLAPIPPSTRRQRTRRSGVGPRHHAQPEPRSHTQPLTAGEQLVDRTARTLLGRRPTPATRERLSSVAHYSFGATLGLLYAPLARRFPLLTAGHGAAYGLAVWLLADELLMPSLGLGKPPADSTMEEHAYAAFAHLAYGLTLETARHILV